MPTLRGIPKLQKALDKLKEVAEEVRFNLEEKQQWLDEKSETYQESEKGQDLNTYLNNLENTLDEIDQLDLEN